MGVDNRREEGGDGWGSVGVCVGEEGGGAGCVCVRGTKADGACTQLCRRPPPPPPPPHTHTHHTPSPFSPSIISLMFSVDVKHHVYLLTWLESGRILSVFCITLLIATENKCIRAVYFCRGGRFLGPSGQSGRILSGGYLVPLRITKASPPLSSPANLPFVCIGAQC